MKSNDPIERISPDGRATLHPYFDLCPESPDGEHFTYFAYEDKAAGTGQIYVARTDGSDHRPVGPVVRGHPHSAALQQWVGNETIATVASDPSQTQLVSIADGSVRCVPGVMRMASPRGGFGLTSTHESRRFGIESDEVAVYRMDLQEGKLRKLFDRDAAAAIHPMRDRFAEEEMEYLYFKHTKWCPDGERFFVVFTNEGLHRNPPPGLEVRTPRVKSLILAEADGSNVRYLAEFGHHPFWHWSGKEVWAAGPGQRGQAFTAYPADGGKTRIVIDGVHAAHSALHPAANRLAMDAIDSPERGMARLLQLDLDTGEQELLAKFAAPDTTHQTGCHPHPVWSRDGRTIYFNVGEDPAGPHLYRMRVEGS